MTLINPSESSAELLENPGDEALTHDVVDGRVRPVLYDLRIVARRHRPAAASDREPPP
jgi:hypothetical protein